MRKWERSDRVRLPNLATCLRSRRLLPAPAPGPQPHVPAPVPAVPHPRLPRHGSPREPSDHHQRLHHLTADAPQRRHRHGPACRHAPRPVTPRILPGSQLCHRPSRWAGQAPPGGGWEQPWVSSSAPSLPCSAGILGGWWRPSLRPPPASACLLSPAGIIDLSQVPHLPVLVPPTPGTPAAAMDRLAYLPATPQPFGSRRSSSPLSPGRLPAPRALAPTAALPLAEPVLHHPPGGPTHLTKPAAMSSSERERERDKSILTSTTTVEHAPIWRPGRRRPRPGPGSSGHTSPPR